MENERDKLASSVAGPLAALGQLSLPIEVRIGSATMTISELLRLRAGAVVSLDRGLDEPVVLLVGDRAVAEGELVAIEDAMGVRITRIIGAPEAER